MSRVPIPPKTSAKVPQHQLSAPNELLFLMDGRLFELELTPFVGELLLFWAWGRLSTRVSPDVFERKRFYLCLLEVSFSPLKEKTSWIPIHEVRPLETATIRPRKRLAGVGIAWKKKPASLF